WIACEKCRLNVMMPAIAWNLLHAIEILKNTCKVVARRCVLGIRANREVCERYAYHSTAIATVLTPQLGYKATAEIVQKAMTSGRTMPDVVLRSIYSGKERWAACWILAA